MDTANFYNALNLRLKLPFIWISSIWILPISTIHSNVVQVSRDTPLDSSFLCNDSGPFMEGFLSNTVVISDKVQLHAKFRGVANLLIQKVPKFEKIRHFVPKSKKNYILSTHFRSTQRLKSLGTDSPCCQKKFDARKMQTFKPEAKIICHFVHFSPDGY